ncbi:MAG: hypothetical protein OXF73_08800 [Gammaproteobacteria bacterium]|nr:hypothetical protein [Gammaproteobacteria bacterium]
MQQGNGKALVNIPSHVIMASTDTAGTSVLLPSLCVADDRIDPKPADIADGSTTAMVEIILMSVAASGLTGTGTVRWRTFGAIAPVPLLILIR